MVNNEVSRKTIVPSGFLLFAALSAAPLCCPAAGLVQNVAELVSAVENAKEGDTIELANITDSARYPNKATGKPQGLEQSLTFTCGVNDELTVDGWKTSKALPVTPRNEIVK